MDIKSNQFIALADIALADADLQASVTTGTTNAYTKRLKAMTETNYDHGEALRQQAAAAKRAALHRLPELLEQAEANLQANGAVVYWAETGEEANRLVLEIAKKHGVTKAAKSKSMVTEETALNHALEAAGITPIETDLGEYILQLNNEPPSHIVAPVIHKSKASIRDIFVEQIGMSPTDDAMTMAHYAGTKLRQEFLTAEMGISGGNFIVAETGTVCLVTNEGNGRMVTSFPPVHVAIIGIEKIVATLEDYATLTQILPRSATGQKLTVYTSMLSGPRRTNDADGPDHLYVILVDNGRSAMYAGEYAEALACIRCGACLNACPVYQVAGGHSYGWVYPGPIGAIVTPLLKGIDHASPLPFASSLCGRCKEVCPVDIDIPRMLLALRRDIVANGDGGAVWTAGIKAWAQGMKSPRLYKAGGKTISLLMRAGTPRRLPPPLSGWTKYRAFPRFAQKSFRDQWKERQVKAQNKNI